MGITVAYPGGDGTNSAVAAEKLFPTDVELVSLPNFAAVAGAAAACEVDYAVLPIESSLAGPVAETHDLLYVIEALSIHAQTVIPIRHALLALSAVPLEEITVVRSHPQALDQCRELLASMPWTTAIAAATTAGAAQLVAEHGDPHEAAIAPIRSAELFGLAVLADDVADHKEAYTRFVSLTTRTRLDRNGGEAGAGRGAAAAWRTAFSFVTDHRPGALHRAIEPFGRHAIDLVQLVSRPIPQAPWRYRFDAVLAGHPLDHVISETLLETRAQTRELKVFGSYPA
jgi:prephenate dehydratase